jgi:hypothetical protein
MVSSGYEYDVATYTVLDGRNYPSHARYYGPSHYGPAYYGAFYDPWFGFPFYWGSRYRFGFGFGVGFGHSHRRHYWW